jgi:hypothetical protein
MMRFYSVSNSFYAAVSLDNILGVLYSVLRSFSNQMLKPLRLMLWGEFLRNPLTNCGSWIGFSDWF